VTPRAAARADGSDDGNRPAPSHWVAPGKAPWPIPVAPEEGAPPMPAGGPVSIGAPGTQKQGAAPALVGCAIVARTGVVGGRVGRRRRRRSSSLVVPFLLLVILNDRALSYSGSYCTRVR
jgi:hypothetical protein